MTPPVSSFRIWIFFSDAACPAFASNRKMSNHFNSFIDPCRSWQVRKNVARVPPLPVFEISFLGCIRALMGEKLWTYCKLLFSMIIVWKYIPTGAQAVSILSFGNRTHKHQICSLMPCAPFYVNALSCKLSDLNGFQLLVLLHLEVVVSFLFRRSGSSDRVTRYGRRNCQLWMLPTQCLQVLKTFSVYFRRTLCVQS